MVCQGILKDVGKERIDCFKLTLDGMMMLYLKIVLKESRRKER